MGRRPELIEVVIAGLSLSAIPLLAVLVRNQHAGDVAGVWPTYITIATMAPVIAFEPFLRRRSLRYLFVGARGVQVLILIALVQSKLPLVELMVSLFFLIQVSMRLSTVNGTLTGLLFIAGITVTGVANGTPWTERMSITVIEIVCLLLAQIATYFRERLVYTSQALESSESSLHNLHSASQSFIEYLQSVEEESAERERFRITRDLHDEIGYSMTNVVMMMNAAPHLIDESPGKLLEYCDKTKDFASRTLRETRQILYKLRAAQKQAQKSPSIRFAQLCREFSDATGVQAKCNPGNLPSAINENAYNILFRTVQMGLINALRHGRACRIELFFWLDQRELRMTIWNDTTRPTIEVRSTNEGIGLKGLRERLQTVNGRLSLGPMADGFQLQVSLPREEVEIDADTRSDS